MGVKIHSLDAANHVVELEHDTQYGLKEGRQSVKRFRNLLRSTFLLLLKSELHECFFFITGHYNNQSNEGIQYSQQGGYFRFLNVLGEIDEPVQFSV